MKYTIQTHTESGSWAAPDGTQSLRYAHNKRNCEDILRDWADTVGRFDDERSCSALVWKGDFLDNVTDLYPDFELTLGPRLGIIWNPC